MKALKLFAVATVMLAFGALQGCVTTQAVGSSPQVTVYAIQSDYIAAVKVAQKYKDLPRCTVTPKPPLCSDLGVIKRLQSADQSAYTALTEAEKAVRTPGFGDDKVSTAVASARAAVSAFDRLAKQYEVK